MSLRELVWGIAALIAFAVAFGTLIWYPILAALAFGVMLFAAGQSGVFRRLKQEFQRFLDYRLYHLLSR